MSLFKEVEYKDYKIKPWSAAKLFRVSPYIADLAEIAEKEGVNLLNFINEVLSEDTEQAMNSVKVLARGFPLLCPVLCISLDIDEGAFEEMPMSELKDLALIVYELNQDEIKNCFAPKKKGRKKAASKKK